MREDAKTIDHMIVMQARSWIGVPFRHQGRSRLGVDCLGLLACVARELKLCGSDGKPLIARDQLGYGHYPDEHTLRNELERWLVSSHNGGVVMIGLFRVDGMARHLAIIHRAESGLDAMIHAYAPARKVVEHRIDERWQQACVACFSLPTQLHR